MENWTETTDRRRFLRSAAGAAGLTAAAGAAGVALAPSAGAQGPGTQYVPLAVPFRTFDSREDPDGPIMSGETFVIDLSEIPDPTIAITTNITVTETQGDTGWLVVFGQGRLRPSVSTINWFGPDQTLANMVTISTGITDNDLNVFCGGGAGTHFIMDIYGWFL